MGAVGHKYLPKYENFQKNVYNRRAAVLGPFPKTLEQMLRVEIPERYKTSSLGQPFLILDSRGEEKLILGFASPEQLSLMRDAEELYMDGTLGAVSGMEFVRQLFVILCDTGADWSTRILRSGLRSC